MDWRWRMVTPAKGDYAGIPMNAASKTVADAWDPAKDETAGEQCKSYGAPAIMSVPGRLHITWQDDTTLKVDTDAGQQTRLLRFAAAGTAAAPAGRTPPSWQGTSVAQWQMSSPGLALMHNAAVAHRRRRVRHGQQRPSISLAIGCRSSRRTGAGGWSRLPRATTSTCR